MRFLVLLLLLAPPSLQAKLVPELPDFTPVHVHIMRDCNGQNITHSILINNHDWVAGSTFAAFEAAPITLLKRPDLVFAFVIDCDGGVIDIKKAPQ